MVRVRTCTMGAPRCTMVRTRTTYDQTPHPNRLLPTQLHEFLMALAVCNTVVPERDPKTRALVYQVCVVCTGGGALG